MKTSAVYNQLEKQVDDLQKQIKNTTRDQLTAALLLENAQSRLRSLMDIIIKEGDRDLTENELETIGIK